MNDEIPEFNKLVSHEECAIKFAQEQAELGDTGE